jgi:hypothetical protein
MSAIDLTHVAREAADWLTDHEWVQGEWGDGTKGCLHQAVRVCDPQPGDGFIVSAVLTHLGYSTGWNDTEGRTEAEVLDVLRSVHVTDAELESTFGPNWRSVVFVVRQAASLTPAQAEQLPTARATARATAKDAAWAAAWDDAGDAAWATAWAAAGAAAGDAALAVVVRDLITPEQYALLVGPWESVMGPIGEAA